MSEPKFKVGDKVKYGITLGVWEIVGFRQSKIQKENLYDLKEIGGTGSAGNIEESLLYPAGIPNNDFITLTEKMNQLYTLKNKNYGASFAKTFDTYGMKSVIIRMSDKLNRLEALTENTHLTPADESITDTLLDLANYSVMAIIEIERKRK